MNFQELNLPNALLRALRDKEYERPTPIQMQAIPAALEGRDILGTAQTGTGKTAAFALPVLANLLRRPPVGRGRPIRALILTPTRELALQIDESLGDYAKYTPLRTCVVFGGVNQRPQIDCLKRGVDVLTATPGRLLDLIGQGHISLKQIEFFVLDEADRMLDMGFIHDIRRLLPLLPGQRQTLLFSATMPKTIERLAADLLNDPVRVAIVRFPSCSAFGLQRLRFGAVSGRFAAGAPPFTEVGQQHEGTGQRTKMVAPFEGIFAQFAQYGGRCEVGLFGAGIVVHLLVESS